MADYDMDFRKSPSASAPRGQGPPRGGNRDRDEFRSNDPYRDRRRSPGRLSSVKQEAHELIVFPDRRRPDRDRRRSRSPVDRYQPDRLRDDFSYRGRDDAHQRRRSSPPPIDRYIPGADSHIPSVNALPDPMKLDFQVGFSWFAEWWRNEQRIKEEKERIRQGKPLSHKLKGEREAKEQRESERPKIQAAYDQYKENLQRQQAQAFVRLHKNEDWFRERYVPEVREPYRRKLMDYRRGLYAQWEQDLTSGLFDEFTLEGIYKSEANGQGGIVEKEEGEAAAAAEVLGVGDLLPMKGGDLRDPVALQPTLLIKTIAPTVTREKFEAFAKEHLGEGEGGFKHLSLSDPNPVKKCHRMGWIILHPSAEVDEKPSGRRGSDAAEEGEENGDVMKTDGHSTSNSSEQALEKINGKTIEDPERGNFTVHCGVHRPPEAPRKKALWDLFSAPERISRDLELAVRLVRKLDNELGDECFSTAKIEERVHNLWEQGALQPVVVDKTDLDVMNDAEEGEEVEEHADDDENDDEELIKKKKRLDLLVEYLRRVYNFCFFCVFESDSVHELQRKCPGGHLRRPRASLTTAARETALASARGEEFPLKRKGDGRADDEDVAMDGELDGLAEEKKSAIRPNNKTQQQLQRAFNWVRTFEEKVLQILEPDNVNLRKLGGTPVEEGVEKELSKHVSQEDTNKFRCKLPECSKLFKGMDFWRKHVEKRHTDHYEKIRAEVELVNTYVLDPAHIAPSRSDASSNGHFPLHGQNMPTGTPRGFQLNPQFALGFPPASGVPSAIPGMFGAGGPNWAGFAAGGGGVGPLRTNGRNGAGAAGGGYRLPGPYARNGRGPGGGGPGGRLPPVAGMPNSAAAAAAAAMMMNLGPGSRPGMHHHDVGPSEAVAGRSLRSYEDLDADTGKGTTELNY